MSFESALHDWLLAGTDLSALIGDRMYPREAPQNVALPYVVRTRVSDPGHHTLRGVAGIGSPRYQFDAYAATSESARDVSAALRARMDGFRGPIGGADEIRDCRLENESDSYEPNADGSEGGLFRQTLDFIVWHRR